ncbi:hypothetical protein [Amycolatopsis keratiniphila]|uniref:Uncharacterized protein n=1 Tax=Amycolatopsis keratiniphila TaxID=129921 RepID=W6HY62_9PSEU|nr:hypothetical protein [Amycolatopsis keratiniphila]AHJ58548.1 hypothetical protein AORI_P033 [Amycolatopsis keratiniphila]
MNKTVPFGPFGQIASSWTAVFVIDDTSEAVAVGSWPDRAEAIKWGRDPWFRGRAKFQGLAPLINPKDFTAELDGGNHR